PGHQVVRQHSHVPARARPELGEPLLEVVDALAQLDHHTLDTQILTPDLLHQLGVVPALHPDARGASHAGACTLDGHRTRGSALRAGRRGGPARWHEPHRPAVHPETRTQREAARLAVPVLEHHHVHAAALLHADHRTDPTGLHILHHEAL